MGGPNTLGIRIIYYVFAPISMFGSATIVLAFGCLPRLRVNGVHFVFFQALCDFLFSATKLISAVSPNKLFLSPDDDSKVESPGALCDFTGFMGQFAGQATAAWSMMITIRIFIVFLWPSKAKDIRNWWFHTYVWTWSLFTAVLMMGLDQYGPTVDGCWIKGTHSLYRIFLFVVPLCIYFVLSIVVLAFVWIRLHLLRMEAGAGILDQFEWRFKFQMILYMVIFISFWTGPIVLRFLEWGGVYTHGIALYIDALSLVLQGTANAIVWAVSKSFCESVQEVFFCGYVWDSSESFDVEEDIHSEVMRQKLMDGEHSHGASNRYGAEDSFSFPLELSISSKGKNEAGDE